jgi:hypothetical protein
MRIARVEGGGEIVRGSGDGVKMQGGASGKKEDHLDLLTRKLRKAPFF